MKQIIILLSVFTFGWSSWAAGTEEQPDRNDEIYNLEGELGLKGYDPVAYFPEFGGQAVAGEQSITATYGKVTYHFVSVDNRDEFLSNPTKYEPTYGGWCAWAMANQAYADIDPKLFTINGNRSHFFISRGAKARFDQDLSEREQAADDYWLSESGEAPRL